MPLLRGFKRRTSRAGGPSSDHLQQRGGATLHYHRHQHAAANGAVDPSSSSSFAYLQRRDWGTIGIVLMLAVLLLAFFWNGAGGFGRAVAFANASSSSSSSVVLSDDDRSAFVVSGDYTTFGVAGQQPQPRQQYRHAFEPADDAAQRNISRTLPPDVWIELLSPTVIDAECLSPVDDANLNIRCRTIILGLYGGTFPVSSIALSAVVHNRVLRPAYNANRLAFGVAQRWGEIVEQIKVTTVTNDDGSLMFLELPNCRSFDLSQSEDLIISTGYRDLVQSFLTPSSGDIVVTLGRQSSTEVNWRIVAFGYVSIVPAAMAAVLPFAPTASELQYLLLFTRSPSCSFPYIRDLSAEMYRIVFPSVTGSDNDAATQLLHNALISIFICIFQMFLVVVLKIVLKCNFPTAMALLYFPSVYMSAALFLLPGMSHASFKLVFYGDDGGQVVGGLVGFIYCGLVSGGLTFWARRSFQNVMQRGTSEHLLDFPKALQLVMPTQSWGPSPRVNSFLVPCAFIGSPERMQQNFRPYAVAVVMGAVTAIEAPTPVWCAVQAAAVAILSIVIPVIELMRPLYRCPSLGYMAAATLAFTALVSLTFFLHGVRPTLVTQAESPLTVMLMIVIFSLFLRSLCTFAVGLLEQLVVKPRVWPAGEVMPNLEVMVVSDSEGDDEDEEAERNASLQQGRFGKDFALLDGDDDNEDGSNYDDKEDPLLADRGDGDDDDDDDNDRPPPLRLTGEALAAVVGTDERPVDLREADTSHQGHDEGHGRPSAVDGTAMFASSVQHQRNATDRNLFNLRGDGGGGEDDVEMQSVAAGSAKHSSPATGSTPRLRPTTLMEGLQHAKGAVKGRLRTLSHFVEAKARENSKAMIDTDDEYSPPNVVPKRRIRRSHLVAGHMPDEASVNRLRAALAEEEASYDHQMSVEARKMGSGGGGFVGSTADPSSALFGANEANTNRSFISNANMSFGGGNILNGGGSSSANAAAAASAPDPYSHVAPILGPIPPVDPAITRRARTLALQYDEDRTDGAGGGGKGGGGGGQGGGRGVKFQIGGAGGDAEKVPIANILQGKGPMPPDLVEARRRDYEML